MDTIQDTPIYYKKASYTIDPTSSWKKIFRYGGFLRLYQDRLLLDPYVFSSKESEALVIPISSMDDISILPSEFDSLKRVRISYKNSQGISQSVTIFPHRAFWSSLRAIGVFISFLTYFFGDATNFYGLLIKLKNEIKTK